MFKRFKYQREYRRKQNADKRKLRKHHEVMRKEMKAEIKAERSKQFHHFLANPFRSRGLSPDAELKREMKSEIYRLKKDERQRKMRRFRENPIKAIFYREKSSEELQMAQWRKTDKKVAFRKRIRSKFHTLREIFGTGDIRKKFIYGTIQSTTFYILSFLIVYISYQMITMLVSKGFNIPTVWYYYRVKFPLFSGSHLYTRAALISIFSAGPMLSLILAFIFLKQYFSKKVKSQNLKLLLLWGFINGINMFFGSYIVGFVTRTEFIYVSEWIFMSSMFDVEEIFFTIVSISICLLIGRLVTPLFLLSSGSIKLIETKNRLFYILSHVFIPWGIGVVVFFLMTSPTHYIPLFMKTITPVFILMPTIFIYNSARNEAIQTTGVIQKSYFRWSIVIILLAILFFYRILLNFGLQLF